jgi:hypothetical protein
MSSYTRIIYEIEIEFYVYFDNSDIKHEKLAINYKTYLDAGMYCKKVLQESCIHIHFSFQLICIERTTWPIIGFIPRLSCCTRRPF